MTLPEIGTQVILGIVGVLLGGVGLYVTYLINKHVENNQLNIILNSLNTMVHACVQEVYQTYVHELKDKNMFDKTEQQKALAMCLEKLQSQLPKSIEQWLENNFDNVKVYLVTLIESAIANIKLVGSEDNERSKECL